MIHDIEKLLSGILSGLCPQSQCEDGRCSNAPAPSLFFPFALDGKFDVAAEKCRSLILLALAAHRYFQTYGKSRRERARDHISF